MGKQKEVSECAKDVLIKGEILYVCITKKKKGRMVLKIIEF